MIILEECLSADTFALSVAGDFDYVADFNGTITTNAFNLNVGGDFSNNDLANALGAQMIVLQF